MEERIKGFLEAHNRKICLLIPSCFSLARLPFIPFIVWAIANGFTFLALFLFSVAAFTDFLDGFFARLLSAQTDLGAFLDPLCDKLLLLPTLFAISAYMIMTPLFTAVVWIVLGIEVALVLLRLPRGFLKYKVSASWYGKTKMGFQVALCSAALLFGPGIWNSVLVLICVPMLILGALSVMSRIRDILKADIYFAALP